MEKLTILLQSYDKAMSGKHGIILQSKKEKLQSINGELNFFGYEYIVYNTYSKNVIFNSCSFKDCEKILFALIEYYKGVKNA